MFAVSTFDAVGGLVIGAGAAIWLIVDGLVEQWRNGRDRMRGGR